jgi:hypothetical protein
MMPVIELQEKYAQKPHILKYALEQTIKQKICEQARNQRWWRYLIVVADNAAKKGHTETGGRKGDELRDHETAVKGLLDRARSLNEEGSTDAARALLSDILAAAEKLAPSWNGDRKEAERRLRLAYKLGEIDIHNIDQALSPYDFYPEWPPADNKLN